MTLSCGVVGLGWPVGSAASVAEFVAYQNCMRSHAISLALLQIIDCPYSASLILWSCLWQLQLPSWPTRFGFPPDVFIFAFYGGCVSCALFRGVLWLWLHYRPLWQTGAHDSGQKHGRLAVDGFCPLQAAPGPWLTAFPASPTLHFPSLQEGQPDPCGA